jgi:hypothetical protein
MQGFSSIIKLELQQLSLFIKDIALSKLAILPNMKTIPLELPQVSPTLNMLKIKKG